MCYCAIQVLALLDIATKYHSMEQSSGGPNQYVMKTILHLGTSGKYPSESFQLLVITGSPWQSWLVDTSLSASDFSYPFFLHVSVSKFSFPVFSFCCCGMYVYSYEFTYM